ncbi:MAG: hypothetical protein RL497_2252 [Pseudomonadota bacterium]|jgi:hypothetical protein
MDNSMGAVHECVVDLFKRVGGELFEPYRLKFDHSTVTEPLLLSDECFMSVLGASAEGIKILCYIRFPVKTGEHIYNGDKDMATTENLRDLCGELNNQLVGKVKNGLLAYQCRLSLGLPTHLSGKDLAISSVHQASVVVLQYMSSAGALDVVVYTIIHDDFSMLDQADNSLVGAVEEGTLAFF